MRKIIYLSNRHRLVCMAWLILLCISCRKEQFSTNAPTTNEELIQEARTYFEKQVLPTTRKSTATTSTHNALNSKAVDWNRAYIKTFSFGKATIVPLVFNSALRIQSSSTGDKSVLLKDWSYLMIYKDQEHTLHAEWYMLIPNTKYSSREHFVGNVIVNDWNGNFIKGYQYKANGTIRELGKNKKKKNGKAPSVSGFWDDGLRPYDPNDFVLGSKSLGS